jgi:hypothetical protein
MERWKRRTRRGLALGTLAAVGFLVSLAFTGVVLATETSTSDSTATSTGTTPTTTETTPTTTETTPTTTETTPTTTQPPPGGEGCTPGYWKNHLESGPPTGFSPGQRLDTVFSAGGLGSLGSSTLLEALSFKGGSTLTEAKQILLRAAVASLLNAAHPDVDFGASPAAIIAAVNAALSSGDRDTILDLASDLDARNNEGCPLN